MYKEMGPYVFAQRFRHVGVTFEDDGNLVTYSTVYQSDFEPDMSKGTLDDSIEILNIGWAQLNAK